MDKKHVDVVIDSREPPEVTAAVESHEEVADWNIDHLPAGDLLIEGVVLVERKDVSDYTGSLTEGRLDEQVAKMKQVDVNQRFILIEGDMGDFDKLTHSQLNPAAARGSIASVMSRHGIPIVPCGNLATLVDLSIRLARKCVEEPSQTHFANVESPDAPTAQKIYAQIDGIGGQTAKVLHQHYPSVNEILRANVEELTEIEGIGKLTAGKIIEAFRRSD